MASLTKRQSLAAVIAVVALAAVACDGTAPPMVITNNLESEVSFELSR